MSISTNSSARPGDDPNDHSALKVADRGIVRLVRAPRLVMGAAIVLAVVLGWGLLLVQAAGIARFAPELTASDWAPIVPFLSWLSALAEQSAAVRWLIALCAPVALETTLAAFVSLSAMWFAMALAMMLPSAAPMLRTYADIAHVARQKGDDVQPLAILAAGYLTIWFGFSLIAAALQLAFASVAASEPLQPWSGIPAAAVLVAAGAYQFSSLREACLEKCRNPFNTLFAGWKTDAAGVYRLGLGQGLFCLGCCWALMMVMFVVGTMNILWMLFFALFAMLEKSGRGNGLSRLSGVALLIWGGLVFLSTVPIIGGNG